METVHFSQKSFQHGLDIDMSGKRLIISSLVLLISYMGEMVIMKVLGISGSPRKSHTTEELVKTVLDATGLETELISLHGMTINGCICCLGCIDDNAM